MLKRFAKGSGLSEKSFGDSSSSANDNKAGGGGKQGVSDKGSIDGSSIAGGSSKTRSSTNSSLPNIKKSGSESSASVAATSSLVEQHEEEMQRQSATRKEKSIKSEDVPQQHYIGWESLKQSRESSQWHGPFNSDGAAHRHLHNSLDFSHIMFEVLLRQPITMVPTT